jgi:chemotaxis protein CheC
MKLNEEQQDILNEIMNIGVGDAAAQLNDMVNCHVMLNMPKLTAMDQDKLKLKLEEELGVDISVVQMKFSGGLDGSASLMFSNESGKKLVNILSDDFDEEDYNTLKSGTLTEVGNIILNSVLAAFSNAIAERLDYEVPDFSDTDLDNFVHKELMDGVGENDLYLCEVNFNAEDVQVDGRILLAFDFSTILDFFKKIQGAA